MSDGNWWSNFAKDQYGNSVQLDEESGMYKPKGFGALFWSQLTDDADEISIQKGKQKTAGARRAKQEGVPVSELNLTGTESIYDVDGKIVGYKQAQKKQAGQTSHRRTIEAATAPLAMELKSQSQNLAADRDIRTKQFALQMEQLRNDRVDRMMQQADELEYRRQRDRKEDIRYNENIERMDRKDRRQSIQTLVQGLASLGAAFAL